MDRSVIRAPCAKVVLYDKRNPIDCQLLPTAEPTAQARRPSTVSRFLVRGRGKGGVGSLLSRHDVHRSAAKRIPAHSAIEGREVEPSPGAVHDQMT
jgi:hypothetical protein